MACGILDLPQCIVEQMGEFLLDIINAPLIPFLEAIKLLLTQPPSIQLFGSIWAVIVYLLSIFFGLFIILAGFNFIISGYSAQKRQQAKEWLQNVVLMIFFVQSSFLLYSLISEVSSGLTVGIFNMIDPDFFLFTLDNAVNIGLEIVLGFFYLMTLFTSIVVFSTYYLFASVGIVFFPIGIFLFFIPPLKSIGKFIINTLVLALFLPFFSSIVLLGASMMINISVFSSMKVLFMISAFSFINVLMILSALLAVLKAVLGLLKTDMAKGAFAVFGLSKLGGFVAGKLASDSAEKEEPKSRFNEREYWSRPRQDYSGYRRV